MCRVRHSRPDPFDLEADVRRSVGVRRRDENRQSCRGHLVVGLERRGEGTEVDIGSECPHGIDGGEDVAAGLTLDEWLDGELDAQHAPIVIAEERSAQSRPITRRSSLARTVQSRPARSKASARRVSAERNEPFHSASND